MKKWQIVDIYADHGLSGRTAEKRGDFQRLLSDCRKGKIDRILVKSISRFARNTKECLELVRELKLLGIGVYFEKKDLWTEGVVKMLKKNQISEIYQRQISSENNGIPLIEAVFTAE